LDDRNAQEEEEARPGGPCRAGELQPETDVEVVMQTFGKVALIVIAAIMLLAVNAAAAGDYAITKKFGTKEVIRVNTISGDCIVRRGVSDEIEVVVINNYTPGDAFEPKFRVHGNTLKLDERINGTTNGNSTWAVSVPEGTQVEFESASGDLSIHGLKGVFVAKMASGNVEIENCRGGFHMNTASGDIDVSGVVIEKKSTFGSASGRVNVELAQSPGHDLQLGSASGRAILGYCGNPIRGYFEFTAKARQGGVVSPFDFDAEEEFHKHGELYLRKTFTKEIGEPHVTIGTASGRAVLIR